MPPPTSRLRVRPAALTLLVLSAVAWGIATPAAAVDALPADRLVVWDGDAHAGGKGWVGPDAKVDSLGPSNDEARDGKAPLRLHADGAGWVGGG